VKTLNKELDQYLEIRRSLGYKLATEGRILRRFVEFARQSRASHITSELFLRWQKKFGHARQDTWGHRLSAIRVFARWLHGLDARHEVPPAALIPYRLRRARPYIYSEVEIQQIIQAAAKLPSIYGFRGLTFSTFFGLVAVTGMRISEAIMLDVGDVDLVAGVVTIRHGKLGKARYNPIADSTKAKLSGYVKERRRLLSGQQDAFFVSEHGTRLTDCCVRYNFALVCQHIGLRPAQHFHRLGRGPRIHDLRHTFAVHTLLNWYRTGKDAAREMIKLTTYLGHCNPAHTYWYIEANPELLQLASRRAVKALAKEVRV
jgi:integrase/recombinase XerD